MTALQDTPARAPREAIHGVLLLDKPLGLSSNTAMQQARRLLGADKVGHGGTLDPLASGLLPLAFGEATKFMQDLLAADKTYTGTIRLGYTSSTDDAEGEITPVAPDGVFSLPGIEEAMRGLSGAIEQVPPMYSALKKDGKPLYAYARAGVEFELAPRKVTVFEFAQLGLQGDTLGFRAKVSKGTYIRCLARDLGKALGCGGYLTSLRRESIHHLGKDIGLVDAKTLAALSGLPSIPARRETLLPLDALIQGLPSLEISQTDAQRLRHGQRLRWTQASHQDAQISWRVYCNNELIGLARIANGVLAAQRLMNTSS